MAKKIGSKIGRIFEKVFAEKYNLKKIKASGALPFYKLDVEGKRLLFSLKATQNKSFSIKEVDLKEAFDAVKGLGGVGPDVIPVLAFCLAKEEPQKDDPMYAVVHMDDLVALLSEKAELFKQSKSDEKYQQANTVGLFRDKKNTPDEQP